jgi:hypothetical protein
MPSLRRPLSLLKQTFGLLPLSARSRRPANADIAFATVRRQPAPFALGSLRVIADGFSASRAADLEMGILGLCEARLIARRDLSR